MPLIHTEKRVGKPINGVGYKITPIEKSYQVQPPGMWGVLRWKRPFAVVIHHPDGVEQVLNIEDQTRKAQFLILGIGLAGSILLLLMTAAFKSKPKNV